MPRPPGALDPAGMLMRSAGSSMDRASDYGSEGWGFDSLPARYQGKRLHDLTHTGSTKEQTRCDRLLVIRVLSYSNERCLRLPRSFGPSIRGREL